MKKTKIFALLAAALLSVSTVSGCSSFMEGFSEGVAEEMNSIVSSDYTNEGISAIQAESLPVTDEEANKDSKEISGKIEEDAISEGIKEKEVSEDTKANEVFEGIEEDNALKDTSSALESSPTSSLDEAGFYYDLEHVILYLDEFGKLPPNYITKKEAKKLGWNGGSIEDYQAGAAIGGDYFGNYEGILPSSDSIRYTECDIDTNGKSGRGAKRLIFSNEPHYYYTTDHYETFTEYVVENGEVKKK